MMEFEPWTSKLLLLTLWLQKSIKNLPLMGFEPWTAKLLTEHYDFDYKNW